MIVCVPVMPDGTIDPRWGRADRVAVADVDGERIASWQEYEVSWGRLHDEGPEGSHHARIARFLREHNIEAVVADHMGPGMENMVTKMGLRLYLGAGGDARRAAEAAGSR